MAAEPTVTERTALTGGSGLLAAADVRVESAMGPVSTVGAKS